jgi:hypothetical protein
LWSSAAAGSVLAVTASTGRPAGRIYRVRGRTQYSVREPSASPSRGRDRGRDTRRGRFAARAAVDDSKPSGQQAAGCPGARVDLTDWPPFLLLPAAAWGPSCTGPVERDGESWYTLGAEND